MLTENDFVDYFSELKGRPVEEQMSLLGHARYEVFARQGHTGKATLLLFLSFLAAVVVASVPSVFGGGLVYGPESLLLNAAFMAVGLTISRHVYKRCMAAF